MAFLNEQTRELHLKILYFGGQNSGKTTNFQSIYRQTQANLSTRIFDLRSCTVNSPFFDFLPLSMGESKSHHLRLHLYSLPAHNLWNSVLMNLSSGVDGLVFVVDSRFSAVIENEKQLKRMEQLLLLGAGINNFLNLPMVVQCNHRDHPGAVDTNVLKLQFKTLRVPFINAVSCQDQGVMETLEHIADMTLKRMENKDNRPSSNKTEQWS